jgi:ABC-type multidrug transport system ATPase subunit
MNELIKLEAISKSFKNNTVVKNVNLTILDKKCQGVIGPNGCGKTTTLNMIAKILFPTEGIIHENIFIDKGEIGFSSGQSGFFQDFNFDKNIKLAYTLKGIRYDEAEIVNYKKLFSIDHSYNKPFKKYSTGMKQKLSIISALIGSPKLIILDEPTNGLDPDGVFELRELIIQLKSQSSVLITSHVLSELEEVCDDVYFMFNGEISKRMEVTAVMNEFGSLENAYKKIRYAS